MRKKARWRLAYGLGFLNLLKCVGIVLAQCNGQPQTITAVEPLQGFITTPNFPQPYRPGLKCIYELSAPTKANLVVQLNIVEVDLLGKFSGSSQCLRDYLILIIIDRTGREHVSQRYCGQIDGQQIPPLKTLQSTARVEFVSEEFGSSNTTRAHYRGFRLHYAFMKEVDIGAPLSTYNDPNERYRRECGGSTEPNEISGEIKSPGYPITYPRDVTCNWLVRVPEGKRVYLRLMHLQLSTTFAECSRACLYIIDGFKHEPPHEHHTGSIPGEIRFCGSHLYYNEEGMKSYLSNGNRVIIRFVTTDYPSSEQQTARQTDGVAIGFKILWTEVNSLVATDVETREADCGSGFTCKGGDFCIDNGHNICAERLRLCINQTLKCNGVSNCAENDNSDEEFCYPEEFLIYICVLIIAVMIMFVIGCLFHCLLKICRSGHSSSQMTENHKKSSTGHRRRAPKNTGQESITFNVHKNSVPRQSISIVSSTKQRNTGRHSQTSDLLSLNPAGSNELNPVWQLDSSSNASSFVRFNNLHRAQV